MPFPALCAPQREQRCRAGPRRRSLVLLKREGRRDGEGREKTRYMVSSHGRETSPSRRSSGPVLRVPQPPGKSRNSGMLRAPRRCAVPSRGEPWLVCLSRWVRVENKMDLELVSLSAAEPERAGLLRTG